MTMAEPKRILVVDDEPDICTAYRFILEEFGYDVHACLNGEAALAYLETHTVDGLITNIMMPGIDGFELIERIRGESSWDFPMLICSAKGGSTDIAYGYGLGIDDFIIKPFEPKALLESLARALQAAAERLAETGHRRKPHVEIHGARVVSIQSSPARQAVTCRALADKMDCIITPFQELLPAFRYIEKNDIDLVVVESDLPDLMEFIEDLFDPHTRIPVVTVLVLEGESVERIRYIYSRQHPELNHVNLKPDGSMSGFGLRLSILAPLYMHGWQSVPGVAANGPGLMLEQRRGLGGEAPQLR